MTTNTITVDGTLQADGVTVQLAQKATIPPGRVILTVRAVDTNRDGDGPSMASMLDRIHRDQQASGRVAMTEEQMAAEILDLRADEHEYEERCREIWSQTGHRKYEGR